MLAALVDEVLDGIVQRVPLPAFLEHGEGVVAEAVSRLAVDFDA
jgi:hypothetical protein